MGKLHDLLLSSDKKKIFEFNSKPTVGYTTGLLPFDYQNGYIVRVDNRKDPKKVPDKWINTGLQGGSFCTIVGNTNVGKTALAVKCGSAMIKDFDLGDFYHIDAEGTSNPTRIMQLNNFTEAEMTDKYHFPDIDYVEDTFKLIYNLAMIKTSNKEFLYDTGKFTEVGEKIIIPQPTAVLIDSLPSLQTKDVEDSDDLGSQTYNMRLAIAYNTFYKRLRPIIRKANINVMAINHIKEKPQLGFVQTQAKVQLLSPNESIPGGSGPLYYSQTLLRLKYRGKYVEEKHGFNGFLAEAEFLKSKTNRSGAKVELVFDYDTGFDEWLTLLHMAQELSVIKGRNPYSFFESDPSLKFNTKEFREVIKDENLRNAMLKDMAPKLYEQVAKGVIKPEKDCSPQQFVEMINNSEWGADADKDFVLEA